MISKVVDVKPRSGLVIDIKPNMGGVINVLPRLSVIYDEVIRWQPQRRGIPIGLLLALTYPNDVRI